LHIKSYNLLLKNTFEHSWNYTIFCQGIIEQQLYYVFDRVQFNNLDLTKDKKGFHFYSFSSKLLICYSN